MRQTALFAKSIRDLWPLAILILCFLIFPPLNQADGIDKDGDNPAGPALVGHGDLMIKVINEKGVLEEIGIEEYLVGVLAAELPIRFAPEAMRAQSIAARTYILQHVAPWGSGRHGEAAVCSDSSHCQAYFSLAERQFRWGSSFEANEKKIRAAVQSTCAVVVTYQGRLAFTPYFSTCGGKTESCQDYWQGNYPYLQPVECSWDSHSPRYGEWFRLQQTTIARALGIAVSDLAAMTVSTQTSGGRIGSLSCGDKTISGSELRSLLELRSTAVSWLLTGDDIILTVRGSGHGVGLCQYGADGMARVGYKGEEILLHYYQGVTLTVIDYSQYEAI